MIDDHMRCAQLVRIVIGAIDGDRAAMHEAMAQRFAARNDPAHIERHDLAAQQRHDPRQRTHPAQRFARQRLRAPALCLGPGERADDRRDCRRQHIGGGAAGLFQHGKPYPVALGQLLCRQPGLAQKPFERLRRGTGARAFHLFAHRLRGQRQSARDQRQPSRGGPYDDRAGGDPGGNQFLAEQAFQIGACARLHPRGDLFAAQFEQKIGAHALHPGNLAAHSSLNFAI